MNKSLPRWIIVALEIISRHKASGDPLAALCTSIFRAKKTGSKERELIREAVFSWARHRVALESHLAQLLKMYGGIALPQRDKDLVVIAALLDDDYRRLVVNTLRQPLLSFVKQLVVERSHYSFPSWFVDTITKTFGEDANNLLEALKQRAQPVLAVDTRFMSVDDARERLEQAGIKSEISPLCASALKITSSHFSLASCARELRDALWLMDDGSQYVAQLAHVQADESVLDLCCGKGNKTRFLAQFEKGKITAVDISEERIKKLKQRIGLKNVTTLVADATQLPFSADSFDCVLVDAPCSGTGTLRRAPDLFSRLKQEDIAHYVQLQQALITSAWKVLKPDGKLIYITCSLLDEENQQQVDWMLRNFPIKLEKKIQLLPHRDGCDGFFVAVFKK